MSINLVAIIANLQQYHLVAAKYPAAGIATADASVFIAAKQQGKVAWDLWSYLSQAEISSNREWSWELCARLADSNAPSFQLGRINLIQQSRHDFFHVWYAIRNTTMAVDRFVENTKPTSVIIFSEASAVNVEAFPVCYPDVFNTAARIVVQRYGLNMIDENVPAATRGRPNKKARIKSVKSRALDLNELQKLTYLSVAVELGISEQQSLYDYLAESNTSEWVVLGDRPPGQVIPFIPVKPVTWLSVNLNGPVQTNPDELTREVMARLPPGDDSRFPVTDQRFSFIWNCFARHCENASMSYQAATFITGAFAPSAIINGYDIYAGGRCFVAGMYGHGVAVYSIDHGTLIADDYWQQYQDGLSHLVVRGEVDRLARLPTRAPGAEVFAAGCLRNDHAMRNQSLCGVSKKIVILTSSTNSGGNFTGGTGCETIFNSWQGLFRWMKSNPDYTFIIKCHPRYDMPAFYQELAAGLSHVHVQTEKTHDVFDGALVSVMMNNATTASLYSIEQGVPVIYLRDAVLDWAVSPFDHAESIPVFREMEKFTGYVESLAVDWAARNELMDKQKKYHATCVSASGREAARRLVEIVSTSRSPVESNRNQMDAAAIVVVTFIRAYLSGGIGLAEYVRRLDALELTDDMLSSVQIRHGSLFKYIIWADDVSAGVFKRLVALLVGWYQLRAIARRSNFSLMPHVVELFKVA